jgi:IS5 family transposase
MGNQQTFSGLAWKNKGKVTRREQFLSEMDAIIPWERLRKLIEPYYPKAGRGRQPLGLDKMLRIYFLQLWFDDIPVARYLSPSLTSVHFGIDDLGARAVETLLHGVRENNRHQKRRITLPTTLSIRESCGCTQ